MKPIACILFGSTVLTGPSPIGPNHRSPTYKTGKIYLGDITDKSGRIVFRVVRHFHKVQAAVVLHGHSELLFYNKHWVKVAFYDVGMPEALPYKLASNTLYFKNLYNNHQYLSKQYVSPLLPPPTRICTGPAEGCFNRF